MASIELLSQINQQYPEDSLPFLQRMNREWEAQKPLKGVKILHNLLNSFETLHKLEPLLRAGADLTVTSADWVQIPHQAEVEDILRHCGIRYIPRYEDLRGEFDIGMDCAARILTMKEVSIRRGVIELTQAGASIYKRTATPYAVVSVDDAYLKNLECMYGTGEAFIRAFRELSGAEIPAKRFIVFGYGKIGQGVVKYLLPFTKDVHIFEQAPSAIALARSRGLNAYPIATSFQLLRDLAREAYGLVTATGVPQVLSRYLSAAEVGDAYMANMGVDDEIGDNFSGPKVLFNKYPINFSLKHPTLMKYLDPIFYAHNLAAEHILRGLDPGFHPLDPQVDRAIVRHWVEYHNEEVDDIWENG
jgi:adenosylhomocysteinase